MLEANLDIYFFWPQQSDLKVIKSPIIVLKSIDQICHGISAKVHWKQSDNKMKIKVKNDHRSKFSNLSNWKEEAWKNQGFNGIRTRDLRDTGAMLYQLSYEAKYMDLLRWSFFTLIYNRSSNIWIISYVLHKMKIQIKIARSPFRHSNNTCV